MNSGIIHKSSCRLVLCRFSVRQNRIIHSFDSTSFGQEKGNFELLQESSLSNKYGTLAHPPVSKGQVGKIDEKGSAKFPWENNNADLQSSGK